MHFAVLLTLAALANTKPGCAKVSCESLKAPKVEGASVVEITAKEIKDGNATYCDTNVYLTHGKAGDRVRIQHYLPVEGWNGRYQGNGGGGLVAGFMDGNLTTGAAAGFVSGATDAGVPENSINGSLWANDKQLVLNFASLSYHEMTLVGKALAKQFYGTPVKYAYWNGCSTGGRQGHMEMQRYPEDYQGIYASAPAIQMDRFSVSQVHPYLVQLTAKEFPPSCVWDVITKSAIRACDELDGAKDGIISNPTECLSVFKPSTVIGQRVPCDKSIRITKKHADMWQQITIGPLKPDGSKLFHGIAPGAPFSDLVKKEPFDISSTWIRDFVMRDTRFDIDSIKLEDLHKVVARSHKMWQDIIGTDNPDLTPFKKAGGKLLSWHGWADPDIMANGTVEYRLKVEETMGGSKAVDEFYRLYLAPGVLHCFGGNGAVPNDEVYNMLIDWVEKGKAPDTIPAAGTDGITRNLCRYPKNLKYSGVGSIKDAGSWKCV